MPGAVRRAAASASVSLTGVLVVAAMGVHVATAAPPTVGLLLAAFGSLVGLALVVAGAAVFRSSFTPRQTLRVAGWNALGVVVIAAAVGLLYAYQSAVGTPPSAPAFSGAVVVAVSAVAHVLIGVNDVRRIRASELAREREKLAVLTRLVRHNLRTVAQYLYGYAERVRRGGDPDAVADDVRAAGEDLAGMYDNIQLIQALVDRDRSARERVDVGAVVERVAEDVRGAHPAASVETAVEGEPVAAAGEYAEDAVAELVENAAEHAGDAPAVVVAAERSGGDVAVTVRDDGPGVPESERAVLRGDREVTQLDHASGLGLWLAAWVADAYGGDLSFAADDAAVTLRLPAA